MVTYQRDRIARYGLDPAAAVHAWRVWTTGLWYYPCTLLTFGLLSPVAFAHAAVRLRRPRLWLLTAVYALAVVAPFWLLFTAASGPVGSLVTAFALLWFLVLPVVACVHLSRYRRDLCRQAAQPRRRADDDPAVRAVLAGRHARERARAIVNDDALMAEELGIGRAGTPRRFDDGGLVDLTWASADVIARHVGLSRADAERVVQLREYLGAFTSVDEVIALADMGPAEALRLRDRGLVPPAP